MTVKKFKPMLAVNSKPEDITEKSLGSIKLEGVRLEAGPDGITTRQLKPFNNKLIKERFAELESFCIENNVTLEGELFVKGWTFKRIDKCCRGNGNEDALELILNVFDVYDHNHTDLLFGDRYARYVELCGQLNCPHVVAHAQYPITSETALAAYEYALAQGFEGICIKAKNAPYKLGRSTLKQGLFSRMKPQDPFDCVVLGFVERQANLCESVANELGQLKKVQDKDQKAPMGMVQTAWVYTPAINKVHKVTMTRNHTESDLTDMWNNRTDYYGKCMSFVAIPVPGQAVPRSPRFDKWREDLEPHFLVHNCGSLYVTWDEAELETCIANGCDEVPFNQFDDLGMNNDYRLGK